MEFWSKVRKEYGPLDLTLMGRQAHLGARGTCRLDATVTAAQAFFDRIGGVAELAANFPSRLEEVAK